MIDKSHNDYWTGDKGDIAEYLCAYSDSRNLDVKPVSCRSCGGSIFLVTGCDDAVQVKCADCGEQRLLLDSAEYWDDSAHEKWDCAVCGGDRFNLQIGLKRRESGSVKWVYVGCRCEKCRMLGCFTDWKINYEPTTELEENI